MNNILVVNNDIDTMSLLKILLERLTFNVKFTSNRHEVIQLANKFNSDLALIDILQKDAIGTLQGEKTTRHIPIILMTGYSLREKSIEFEVQDIIEKPFSIDLLVSKINHQLKMISEKGRGVKSPIG